jgi:hypothetical protein
MVSRFIAMGLPAAGGARQPHPERGIAPASGRIDVSLPAPVAKCQLTAAGPIGNLAGAGARSTTMAGPKGG